MADRAYTCPKIRGRLHDSVEREGLPTADALGERRQSFMKLKGARADANARKCSSSALTDEPENYVFARRPLPEWILLRWHARSKTCDLPHGLKISK